MAKKHHVVVDGSNLATEGRTLPSLAQLDEAVRAYAHEDPDAEIVVVVDASFGHRIDPSERAQFDQAELHGELVSPPAGAIGRGDAFVLRIAERTGATVLSNDSFQEFHAEHPWLFDAGRLVGGKPVPTVGWIFTARVPVRGAKSRKAVGKAKRDAAVDEEVPAPVKAAELARAAKKIAARRAGGAAPRIGDVWTPGTPPPGLSGASDAAKATGTAVTEATPAEATVPDAPVVKKATKAAKKAPKATKKAAKATKKTAKVAEKAPKAAKKATKATKKTGKATKKTPKATKKAAKPAKEAAKSAAAKVAKRAATATKEVAKKAAKRPTSSSSVGTPTPATRTARASGSDAQDGSGAPERDGESPSSPTDGQRRVGGRRRLLEAIDQATAEALSPPATADPAKGEKGKGKRKPKSSPRRRSAPPPAVNEPLAFINFVAAYPIGSEVAGEVASFTSHGAMVDVALPDGGSLHCYIPLAGLGDPPPRKAREMLSRGERRAFVLVSLDPPRRVAELELPPNERLAVGASSGA